MLIMKVKRILCLEGVVVVALASFLRCFVDGTACYCADRITANVNLDDCKCYLKDYCMVEFLKNRDSTPVYDESMIDVTFFTYKIKKNTMLPVYNITFKIIDEKIEVVTFVLKDDCLSGAPRCRYFHFKTPKHSPRKVVFYNKEFFFSNPWGYPCTIEVKGLSNQLVLLYHHKFLTKVPESDHIEQDCERLSHWRSFVTVDQTSYKEGKMRMSFTTPPEYCNVTAFKLRLKEKNETKHCETVQESTYMPSINKVLRDIDPGVQYTVEVEIDDKSGILCKGSCGTSSSPVFLFEVQNSGFHPLIIACIVTSVVFTILIVGLIWMLCRKSRINYSKLVTVYIAYSHDVEQHENVIKLLAEYLRRYCFCDVKLDILDLGTKDPQAWVRETISNADYIFIIWSRGALLKICKENTYVLKHELGHVGNDLFSTAMAYIRSRIKNELGTPQYWCNLRKFVNICFSYVPPNAVSSEFDCFSSFHLPSQFNALLCHIHDCGRSPFPFSLLLSLISSVFCRYFYPLVPFSNLNETKEGIELIKAFDEMNKMEKDQKGGWLKKLPFEQTEFSRVSFHDSDETKYDKRDTSDEAEDTGSDSSEQSDSELHEVKYPPPVHNLPIFKPGNARSSAYSPAPTQSLDFSPISECEISHI